MALGAAVSLIGLLTMLMRKNIVVMLMGLEMILLGAVVALLGFAHAPTAAALVFWALIIGAGEVAIALALVLNVYKTQKSVWVDEVSHD
jgi:NADH-quinone oxidoreductase subunit K